MNRTGLGLLTATVLLLCCWQDVSLHVAKDNDTGGGHCKCTHLEKRIDSIEKEFGLKLEKQRLEIDSLKTEIETLRSKNANGKKTDNLVDRNKAIPETPKDFINDKRIATARPRRYLAGPYTGTVVGFTAYLDHSIVHLQMNQPVIFDKTLFNEGNSYNSQTAFSLVLATEYFCSSLTSVR